MRKSTSCLFLLVLLFGSRANEEQRITNNEEVGKIFVGTVFGTKWCGPGNIAKDYNDLGSNTEVDRCCREHDHCPHQIKSGKRWYNTYNDGLFTMLSCQCDRDLEVCLDRARSLSSYAISTIYTIFNQKCFHVIEIPCTLVFARCSRHSEDGEQHTTIGTFITENNFTDLNKIYNVESSTTPVPTLASTTPPTMSKNVDMVKEQNNNILEDVEEYHELLRQPSPPQFYPSPPLFYYWLPPPRHYPSSPPLQDYPQICCIEELQRL